MKPYKKPKSENSIWAPLAPQTLNPILYVHYKGKSRLACTHVHQQMWLYLVINILQFMLTCSHLSTMSCTELCHFQQNVDNLQCCLHLFQTSPPTLTCTCLHTQG